MTPTLVRQHRTRAGAVSRAERWARARDWSEIQERMLVPLYESVHARLEVGEGTRLLGLDCGSGLALLLAAARGAAVTGVDAPDDERLALARERLLPDGGEPRFAHRPRLVGGRPEDAAASPAYTLITAFDPIGCREGDAERLTALLGSAVPLAEHGAAVVLTGWGPPERCATAGVLRETAERAEFLHEPGGWRPAGRDDLEDVARRTGLRPDGSGRVACPFGYADLDSALRGLLSTGLCDPAVRATDPSQVAKELAEALHPYRRPDGTVWMPNVFRYLIARVP